MTTVACELCRQGFPLRMNPDRTQEHIRAFVVGPRERGHREEVLGPCTDPARALVSPENRQAHAQLTRKSLSEVTNRIRSFGGKRAGAGFTEKSVPAEREPGEEG